MGNATAVPASKASTGARSRGLGALLLWVLVLILGPGCILLVHDDVGGTCSFQGQMYGCGQCVARMCQQQVNNCCAQRSACGGALANLDNCATLTDTSACGPLLTASGGPAGNLAACIAGSCPDCNLTGIRTDGGFPLGDSSGFGYDTSIPGYDSGGGGGNDAKPGMTDCTLSSQGPLDTSCHCSVDTMANTVVCNDMIAGGMFCCADMQWPLTNLQCSCQQLSCKLGTDFNGQPDCDCQTFGGYGPYTSCSQSIISGPTCCADSYSCRCGTTPCLSSEFGVPSCDTSNIPCGSGLPVRSCSQ
jgi:hypothetical protein